MDKKSGEPAQRELNPEVTKKSEPGLTGLSECVYELPCGQLSVYRPQPVAEEAAQVLAFLADAGRETDFLLLGPEAELPTVEKECEIFARMLADPNCGFFVARLHGEVIATCSVNRHARERMAHVAELALAVRKSCWHMGVGTALMQHLIMCAKKLGCTNVELAVHADNVRAIALYEHLGFTLVGRHKRRLNVRGTLYDELLMDLYLD